MMYDFKDMVNFDLIIGDFVRVGAQLPEGLFAKVIPAGLTAHI